MERHITLLIGSTRYVEAFVSGTAKGVNHISLSSRRLEAEWQVETFELIFPLAKNSNVVCNQLDEVH